MPKAHAVINELSRLLGGKQYFTGDGVSLADLMVAPQLDFLSQTPEWACVDGQDCQSRRLARSYDGAQEPRRNDLGAHRRARRSGLMRYRTRLPF